MRRGGIKPSPCSFLLSTSTATVAPSHSGMKTSGIWTAIHHKRGLECVLSSVALSYQPDTLLLVPRSRKFSGLCASRIVLIHNTIHHLPG